MIADEGDHGGVEATAGPQRVDQLADEPVGTEDAFVIAGDVVVERLGPLGQHPLCVDPAQVGAQDLTAERVAEGYRQWKGCLVQAYAPTRVVVPVANEHVRGPLGMGRVGIGVVWRMLFSMEPGRYE